MTHKCLIILVSGTVRHQQMPTHNSQDLDILVIKTESTTKRGWQQTNSPLQTEIDLDLACTENFAKIRANDIRPQS